MRSYILLTVAWVFIFICGYVVGILLPYDFTPVGNDRVVEKPVLFDPPLKKGVENLNWEY